MLLQDSGDLIPFHVLFELLKKTLSPPEEVAVRIVAFKYGVMNLVTVVIYTLFSLELLEVQQSGCKPKNKLYVHITAAS